jgi:hypothetical protein
MGPTGHLYVIGGEDNDKDIFEIVRNKQTNVFEFKKKPQLQFRR